MTFIDVHTFKTFTLEIKNQKEEAGEFDPTSIEFLAK